MTDQTLSPALLRRTPMDAVRGGIGDLPVPVLIYLITVVIPMNIEAGPLLLTTLRMVLMVLVVPLVIRLLMGQYGRLRPTDFLFAGYVLWSGLAIGMNNPSRMVEFVGSTGLEFFGGYMMGRAYIRGPDAFLALARFLILFLLLTMPTAIYESITGTSPLLEGIRSLPAIDTMGDNTMEQRMGLWRVQLTFAHPIHYGLFASVAFSLAFVGLKGQTNTAWRYLSSALIGICVFLSLSSGAVLALVLQIMMITWAFVFAGMRRRWHLLIGMFVVAYVVIDFLSTRKPIDVFLTYATFNSETAYWRSIIFEWGMKNVWGDPVFGIGLNDWVRPFFMRSASVDNFWLLTAMRYGIPGFLLLATGYVLALAKVMRCDFSNDPVLRQIRLAWVFTFMGMSFSLSTVAIWTNIYSFVFFMFASGLWLTEAQTARAPAAPAPPPRGGTPPRRGPGPDAGAQAATPVAAPAAGPRYTRFPPAGRPASSAAGTVAES